MASKYIKVDKNQQIQKRKRIEVSPHSLALYVSH